ncbi:MAG: hypothetical protein IJM46_11985 [Oscillospiraceae bacterium]|nr:hypothetical protein [Oscillospiraceae bacterium]
MASIYTDDARVARYTRLRRKRNILEKIRGGCMIIALLLAIGEAVPTLLDSVVGGLAMLRGLDSFFVSIFAVLCAAAAIYAIYKRNWIITLAVLVVISLMCSLGVLHFWGYFLTAPLFVALICDIFWVKLSQEEGFPQFQLELDRHAETEKAWDYTARKNALESGARVAATGSGSDQDMHDLLDEGAEVINAGLTGYQARSEGADPLVHKGEKHSDIMDTLEEF